MTYPTSAATAIDSLNCRPIHIRVSGIRPTLDDDEKGFDNIETLGGAQQTRLVAEIWRSEDGWRQWPGDLALDAVDNREAVEAQLQAILTRPAT